MKWFVRVVCILLAASMLFMILSARAEELSAPSTSSDPVPFDWYLADNNGVRERVIVPLREVNVQDLIGMSAEEVEATLYPTGMELPTKYLDFMMFHDPWEDTWQVYQEVKIFLDSYYPSADGYYTYAEIRTVEIYLGLINLIWGGGTGYAESAFRVVDRFITASGLQLDGLMTTVDIVDVEKLHAQLAVYELPLDMDVSEYADVPENDPAYQELIYPPEGDGIQMGFNRHSAFDVTFNRLSTPLGRDSQVDEIIAFFESRMQYLDIIGAGVVPGAQEVIEPIEKELDWSVWDYYTREEPIIQWVVPPVGGIGAMHGMSIEQIPVSSAPVEPSVTPTPSQDLPISESLASFETGIDSSDVTIKRVNLQDILVYVSIFIVIVGVVALFVVDFIRKRKDPTRTFKWKR